MSPIPGHGAPAASQRRHLFTYSGGFLTQRRVRRILTLAGYDLRLGMPRAGDVVGVWGNAGTAYRGAWVAARSGVPTIRIEDTFLRSLHPGRAGQNPPLGLLIDTQGLHFDPSTVSDLEQLLATHPLDDPALLTRAKAGMARIAEAELTKYSAIDTLNPPHLHERYVVVIDQTRGDASVRASGGDRSAFVAMLRAAQANHPDLPILIKTHPETAQGFRAGHFDASDAQGNTTLLTAAVTPQQLFRDAVAVYTFSSQLGFEAILAGHRPHVFGHPFYMGWGLTDDATPLPRRSRKLSKAQLFAASMLLYPVWYDPYRDRLCPFETAVETLAAQTRTWREDHRGWRAAHMRLWKRRPLQDFFGSVKPVIFDDKGTQATRNPAARRMVWASAATDDHRGHAQIEDGFLRSKGLGATLVPPLSLVCDDLGIYYDPSTSSRLEDWITKRAVLRPDQEQRAQALIAKITAQALSKYNLGAAPPDLSALPQAKRILVPGQVENDASILRGTQAVRSNQALLARVRRDNPQAVILYKPHPDVEAGLRRGALAQAPDADLIVPYSDPALLLDQVDEVWTMTSLLGFEALLRGLPVVTLGAPFYAGWGLTRDLDGVPDRRTARPGLTGLVHASLIDYPRYRDPVTGLPCPVEVIVDRLAEGKVAWPGLGNRILSKLQGIFASQAHLWRR